MSEIEITLPTVAYGNVKVRATPEELGLHGIDNSYELGMAAAVYLNLFSQGFKTGAGMDVSPPQEASRGVSEAQARRYLDEGLGGVTEVSDHTHKYEYGDDGHGHSGSYCECGIEDPSSDAPWNKERVINKQPKPWEASQEMKDQPSDW